MLRRGIEAVAIGNPDAQVLLGGMVFADHAWIEAVCDGTDSGDRVDIIPFHAYPETWTPPDVTVERYLGSDFPAGFVATADEACGRKPIWINETGYATTPGRSEAAQADWWIRAIATFAAEPRIEGIGIYEIKDLPGDRAVIGDAPNYHLGLTHVDRRRKLAFGAVSRLVSLFGDQPFTPSRPRVTHASGSAGEAVHRHLFTRADGRQILVLWTRGTDIPVDVEVGGQARDATEYTLDGTVARRVSVTEGWLRGIALRARTVRFFAIAPVTRAAE